MLGKSWTSWVALALAAVLIASSTASWAQATGDPVKIGVLNDQSGVYADITGQGSVLATRMAVEDFGGKVLGRPIEVIFADHQNKPDVASSIINRWIDQENVQAIVDVPNSAIMLGAQEICRQKKRILLDSGGAASDFTGKNCSPYGFHWTYDTYALAKGLASATVKEGGDTWFLITVDYAYGLTAERDLRAFVTAAGGKVLGSVRHPLATSDFSSFLLQAQASKAKIVAFLNAGGDTVNCIKQAGEFRLADGGQRLAGFLVYLPDIHSLGLKTAKGLTFVTAFYWDLNDDTRAWSKRFFERHKAMPSQIQAGCYSAVNHYLKAVQAAGSLDADAVAAKMREMPVNDFFATGGKVRVDGRMVHDMYLAQVKAPEESKYPWDYYKVLQVIPGDQAFRPLAEGGCPLVK